MLESKKYLLICFFLFITLSAFAVHSTPEITESPGIRFDLLALFAGIVGLLLLFLPYVSVAGLILCIAAIVLSIIAKKKNQRKLWRRLGWITGSIGVLSFLAVLALVTFY